MTSQPDFSRLFEPTILDEFVLTWDSQAGQYPESGPPGITYFRGDMGPGKWVDCLLFRTADGELIGILNRYPVDFPPYEVKGNVNIWVRPDWKRNGIATALVRTAAGRWKIVLEQQRFTWAGSKLAQSLVDEGIL